MEKELTPKHLRCTMTGSCPGVWEIIIPEHLKCALAAACPGISQKEKMLKITGFSNTDGTGEEITCYLPIEYFANVKT